MQILAVDDDEVNREVISECFQDRGFKVITATDGEEALKILESSADSFSAFIIDRLMPNLDGMSLLRRIKEMEANRDVPVIMQTALGTMQEMKEGFDAGAYHYITKPYTKELLETMVVSAVENFLKFKELKQELRNGKDALRFLGKAEFQLKTIREANELAPLLANACPNPDRALIGIIELLNNAIEHGNLEISYDQKSKLHHYDSLMSEIERRLNEPMYKDRKVTIHFEKLNDKVLLRIEDEGKGFDWEKYFSLHAMSKNAFKSHGRGIFMANKLSFDVVRYLGAGNIVEMEILRNR